MPPRPQLLSILTLLAAVSVLNIPGFVAIHWYFADCKGLACLGLAYAYFLYVAWGAAYLLYFLLLLAPFRRTALRVAVVYPPALMAVGVVAVFVPKLRSLDELLVTLLAATVPNLVMPVFAHWSIRRSPARVASPYGEHSSER